MQNEDLVKEFTKPGGLGNQMASARRAAGLSARSLAEVLRWTPSRVTRIEFGRQMPTEDDVQTYLFACGAKEEQQARAVEEHRRLARLRRSIADRRRREPGQA